MRGFGGLACVVLAGCGPPAAIERPDDLRPIDLTAPSLGARVAGCWSLSWDFVEGVPGTRMVQMPDSVELRGGVVFGGHERVVTPATHPSGRGSSGPGGEAWESRLRVNRWSAAEDALEISFSDGEREEWRVTLELADGELEGVADYYLDGRVTNPAEAVSVSGRRISCDIR